MTRKFLSHLGALWGAVRARLVEKSKRKHRVEFRRQLQGVCFRKLEVKRVLSVSASFVGNVLQIQYDGDASNQATLNVLGGDFILDTDGNTATTELTGALADLQRLEVSGNQGAFTWLGDFSLAPLNSVNASGYVVDISGLATVELDTSFKAVADVRIDASSSARLGGSLWIGGDLELSVAVGAISDNAGTSLWVSGEATLSADSIEIGDDPTDNINVGSLRFDAIESVFFKESGDIQLSGNSAAKSLSLVSAGSIRDNDGATVTIDEAASFVATSNIELNEGNSNRVIVGGLAYFQSGTTLDIGPAGRAEFGSLRFEVQGAATIQEDDNTSFSGDSFADSLALTSTGSIEDTDTSTLQVTRGATFRAGTDIHLNNTATNRLLVGDVAYFVAGTTLDIGPAGRAEFGSLRFEVQGAATIQEDDSTSFSGDSFADSLILTSTGSIEDTDTATLQVTQGATFRAGLDIHLNNAATNRLLVGDVAYLVAGTTLDIGPAGRAEFGSLQFEVQGAATIQEDDSTSLSGDSFADSLILTSTGSIEDTDTATLQVTQGATFRAGTDIHLNKAATNRLLVGDVTYFVAGTTLDIGPAGRAEFGSLRFEVQGAATIQEDDSTSFSGDSFADSLVLMSTGSIEDTDTATLQVTQEATFRAGLDIHLNNAATNRLLVGDVAYFVAGTTLDIGPAGRAEFGSLRLEVQGAATIQEDDNTSFSGDSFSDSLVLMSTGSIEDTETATLQVTQGATFRAGTDIHLNNAATNRLLVGDVAYFVAGTTLDIGPAGRAEFGSLRFEVQDAATIQEDDSTSLGGDSFADSLVLTSTGSIEDTDTATLQVTQGATFRAGTDIHLNNAATNRLLVGDVAYFVAGTTLDIGPAGRAEFGSLQFEVQGAATIQEDDNTSFSGDSFSDSLALTSTGSIQDTDTATLQVTQGATFRAGTDIHLNNAATNRLLVGDVAYFVAGTTLDIGPAGRAEFGSLRFEVQDAATIQEDDSTSLGGDSFADSLVLTSTGSIEDTDTATLQVTQGATFRAGTDIHLNNAATNRLLVGDVAYFVAGTTLDIGPAGRAEFGSLQFEVQGAATIQEDDSTSFSGDSLADSLILTSTGSIEDTDTATLQVTQGATFRAGLDIHLNNAATNRLLVGDVAYFVAGTTLDIGPAGRAEFGSLQFEVQGAATIQEDDGIQLSGSSNAAKLRLETLGALTDMPGASLEVDTNAVFVSNSLIALADQLNENILVTETAFFKAQGTISVGATGVANFGSLGLLTPSSAVIREASALHLDGVSVNSLDVSATDLITQSGEDTGAGTKFIEVQVASTFSTTSVMSSLLLMRSSSNPSSVVDDGELMDNRFEGSFAVAGVDTDLRWRNISSTATVGGIPSSLRDLEIDFPFADMDLGARLLNMSGDLGLYSGGSIVDHGATVFVAGNAELLAADEILLADIASEAFSVVGDAYFGGENRISLGGSGTLHLGTLRFNSAGDVSVLEDSSIQLSGSSSSRILTLQAQGELSDGPDVTVSVLSNATFTADQDIRLNFIDTNLLRVGGLASFMSGADLEIGDGGRAEFGSLKFEVNGTAAIHEDDSTLVVEDSSALALVLSTKGRLEDADGATLVVTNDAHLKAVSTILLADKSSNRLIVGGIVHIEATDSITIDEPGIVEFGGIQVRSGSIVYVQEDDESEFSGESVGQALTLLSAGSITDREGASIRVVHGLTLVSEGRIELGEHVTNSLVVGGVAYFDAVTNITIGDSGEASFGSLQFSSIGSVEIQEDSSTDLVGLSEASSLRLSSLGSIQDDVTVRLLVTNSAQFESQFAIVLNDELGNVLSVGGAVEFRAGTDVTIGAAGQANFGTLQFMAGSSVTIVEDDSVELAGVSSVGQALWLSSAGDIEDNRTATVSVLGDAWLDSAGFISLNDEQSNRLQIQGFAQFQAASSLMIGEAGVAEFGSLRFLAGTEATVYEDSDVDLRGTSKSLILFLESTESIRDHNDVSMEVGANATLIAAGEIRLSDSVGERLVVGGAFLLQAGDEISIGTLGVSQFGTLQFVGGRSVTIHEDDGMDLFGSSSAVSSLSLISSQSIRDDQSVRLSVGGVGSFAAGASVELADSPSNYLDIRGAASFEAGDKIVLDADGTVFLGAVRFRSGTDTIIYEDDDTVLYGDSVASTLLLESRASIGDSLGTSVVITGDARLFAGSTISIADNGTDSWVIGSHAVFDAPFSIQVGAPGFVSLGRISLFTIVADIQEDDDSLWEQFQVSSLRYSATGYIKNLVEDQVLITGSADLSAGRYIHLGRVDVSRLSAVTNGVGTLDWTETTTSNAVSPSYLFQLSDVADEKGLSLLTDLPAYANTANFFLGKSSAELSREYSFQQNLGRSYGLFITNADSLIVDGILAQDPNVLDDQATERPNVYLQTLTGDIGVTGAITTRSSTTQNGALVLVAGDRLQLLPGGELVTEQVSDAQALQRVLSNTLRGNAYSYDELFGDLVTTKFLFPNDYPYLPSPITSKFHTIALSFGDVGEIGFEFIVQYGDASGGWPRGVVRTFSEAGDIVGSNVLQGTRGDIPIISHVQASGGIATVVRNSANESADYYYDVRYLADNPTVDSTIIIRRSTDFFLFENGGAIDLAAVIDKTAVQDSSRSLAGTADPPGVPLPPDVEPFRFVEVERPSIVLNESSVNVQNIEYDERRANLQDEVEVAIYKVRFEDRNENGQVDRGEEPTADQILDVNQKRILQETKDVKGRVSPSANLIRQWQMEYEEDPGRTAGAYVIIGADRIRGPVVIGSFILRDGVAENTAAGTSEELPEVPTEKVVPEQGPQPEDGTSLDRNESGELVAVAAGSVLWLQRFRARQQSSNATVDYSRSSRRLRGVRSNS